MKNLQQPFPERKTFAMACRSGLSSVRPLAEPAKASDEWGWNFGQTAPPSYWAYGRLRALLTLRIASLIPGKRVFEVAAGDGALAACLHQGGREVSVNDLREQTIRKSLVNFTNSDEIDVVPGNIFDVDPAHTGVFDLVIACEVLEHVADPVALVRKLRDFVSPNGYILLTTPNGAYFRNKLPSYNAVRGRQDLVNRQFLPDADGHLFLITDSELREVACAAGLRVDWSFVWGTPFISGESGFRLLKNLLPVGFWFTLEKLSSYLPNVIRQHAGNSSIYLLSTRGDAN